MPTRKKRLKKQEQSLLEQARKHRVKAKTKKGRKYTTQDYWLEEAKRFEKQAEQRAKMLKKILKKSDKNKT